MWQRKRGCKRTEELSMGYKKNIYIYWRKFNVCLKYLGNELFSNFLLQTCNISYHVFETVRTYLMMLSGIWMQSIGISSLSSDKLLTYLILLLNLELKKEKRRKNIIIPCSFIPPPATVSFWKSCYPCTYHLGPAPLVRKKGHRIWVICADHSFKWFIYINSFISYYSRVR